MKTRLIFSAALFTASLFLNGLKAQNFADPVNITTNLDAVLNFNNTDGAWQYMQFKTNGIRKAYLGLDGNGTDFIFGKENGGSFIFAGANLGIGISNPSAALHIKNDEAIRIQAAQGLGWIGQIKMVDASIGGGGAERDDMLFSTPGGFMFKMDNNVNGVSSIQGFNIYDRNDNSVFVVKESTGNIGIGTILPTVKLEVVTNDSWNNPPLRIGSDDGYEKAVEFKSGTNLFSIAVNNGATNAFLIDHNALANSLVIGENGKIGIGTVSPSDKLHLGDDSQVNLRVGRWGAIGVTGGDIATIIGNNIKASTSINNQMEYITTTADGGRAIRMRYDQGISFHTFQGGVTAGNAFSGYERMRIDNNGNVGIGTDSPSQVLEIENLNPVINIKTTRDGTNAYGYIDFNDVDSKMGHIGFVSTTKDNFTIYNAIGNIIIPAGDVGIGTNSPNSKLHVIGEIATSNSFLFRKDDRSGTAGLSMSGTGTYIHVQGQGLIGHADNSQDLGITGLRFRNLKLGGTALINGSVGIGTTDAGAYKLAVEGQIGARSVKVTQAVWADYVFAPSYKLMPLEQVEAYIQKNQHLPNVAPAQEIEQDGFILEEMDAKLMEKIEELTLYVIELQKQDKEQKDQIKGLEDQNSRVERLEKELKALKDKVSNP